MNPHRKSDPDHPESAPRADRPDIAAWEVQAYVFCPRSWWLQRFKKVRNRKVLAQGIRHHAQAGGQIAYVLAIERMAHAVFQLIGVMALLLIAALIVSYLYR
jgi:hypothetical protein